MLSVIFLTIRGGGMFVPILPIVVRRGGCVMGKILVLVGLFSLLICKTAMAWHGYVVKVLDGDSLQVKRGNRLYEIRLYGIDTPEYKQPYGNKAKRFTKNRTWKKTVTIEPRDVDRYGRIVALVKSEGRLVNSELVGDGLAWVYPMYCKEQPLCREMKKGEVRARKQGRGLWKEKNPVSPWEWKRRKKK